ncbi:hypothetical protein MSAN_02093200 [Mycena sanguinolenta]|uniref:HAT C-terminal dimerisation domain-containing protein n=1 Tax=Mycena sanguinolenta TaxID=230812 RepID=A0A8H6XIE7_9AGAR|nr:hypothetical protein MSAN_02093200 [Mycena sanguinolenta]
MSGSGKPTRARTAPKHLVDGSNSEAPNAAHQAIVDATQARLNAAAAIAKLIQNIEDLDALLPTTIAEGTEDDEIHRVLTTIQGLDPDSPSSTFTRRFDILFKEDAQCRDADGRLHLIRRGELGMLMVATQENTELSEEKADDFFEGENLQEPASNGKRKLIVVDGVTQPPPPKKIDDLLYSTLTFSRSVGKNQLFGDEKPAPPLGNLATHITSKHDGVPVPSDVQPGEIRGVSATSAKIMADFLLEGKLNPAINSTQKNFLKVFAAWIIEDDLPFTTGETPGIQRLFAFLQTRYGLPSDTTNVKSKIAVATDTWTTRAMTFTFAGTIASWITADWELVERVLDFHPIEDKEHEALDNASPNDVLLQALSRLLMRKFDIQFVPANSQIRCLAHVVNLVVQKFLAALDDAEDPENVDDYIPNKDLPFHYDADSDPEVIAMEQEVFTEQPGEENEEDDASGLKVCALQWLGVISQADAPQLRTTATKICSSPQRRKRFRDTAVRVLGAKLTTSGRPLSSLMVVRDVRHRWNYTEAMIERGVMLQKAIDTWVLDRPELRALWLKAEDWKFLESLGEKFTEVTKEMSRSRTPTLPWVLPMYEGMRKHLKGTMDTATYPSLRTAAGAALDKLESYYSKACNSQLNIVATLLHPSLGISWFRKLDPAHQLSAAHAQVLFEHVYDSYRRTPVDTPRQPSAPTPPSRSTSFLDDICMVDVPDISKPTVTVLTELERFWIAFDNYSGPPNGTLKWWKEHEHEFPIISKIARDFLAIPGTSVSVERLFSNNFGGDAHQDVDQRGATQAGVIGLW